MRAGSNSKVDSKAPSKDRPHSKQSSKKWFGKLANGPHRLRNFRFTKGKNSEETTNDEVHSWRRDRRGFHLLLRFVERIRDRWMRLMDNALGEASLPSKAEEVLRKFFNEMSTFMINQSEPRIS